MTDIAYLVRYVAKGRIREASAGSCRQALFAAAELLDAGSPSVEVCAGLPLLGELLDALAAHEGAEKWTARPPVLLEQPAHGWVALRFLGRDADYLRAVAAGAKRTTTEELQGELPLLGRVVRASTDAIRGGL